jgi:hypothetical protein
MRSKFLVCCFLAVLMLATLARSNAQSGLTVISDATFGGGQQSLDNTEFDNVTFKGAQLLYHGTPLVMKNVTFENCVLLPVQSADPKVEANLNKLREAFLGRAAHNLQFQGARSLAGFSLSIP